MTIVPALYALICLIWGSTWLVIKIGLFGVPPFLAAALRFSLSSATLFAVVGLRRVKVRLTRDDKISIWSCGLLSFTLSYACVYWSEQYISSGLTAVLYCTMPLMVALLSRFWTRSETLTGRRLVGIGIGMAGTTLLFYPAEPISRAQWAGMGAALVSAAAAAINLVTIKRHAQSTDIYVLNAFGMAIGACALLLLSLAAESFSGVRFTASNVAAIVYLALVGSVVAFLSYTYLIKVMPATTLSLITLIFPIVAVLLGWAVLRERLTAAALGGMATVLAGVAITVLPTARLDFRRKAAILPP